MHRELVRERLANAVKYLTDLGEAGGRRLHLDAHVASILRELAPVQEYLKEPDYKIGPCGFIPMNLDAESSDDLDAVAFVLAKLGTFAMLKAQAQRLRVDGEITKAQGLETVLEAAYAALPPWARW